MDHGREFVKHCLTILLEKRLTGSAAVHQVIGSTFNSPLKKSADASRVLNHHAADASTSACDQPLASRAFRILSASVPGPLFATLRAMIPTILPRARDRSRARDDMIDGVRPTCKRFCPLLVEFDGKVKPCLPDEAGAC